jgi:hypothetical protein
MKTLGFILVSVFLMVMFVIDLLFQTYYLKDYRGISRKEVEESFTDLKSFRDVVSDFLEF